MVARLQRIWYRSGPPPLPLRLLARAFGLAVRARGALYRGGWLRSARLARPVVVVGNLVVGGSGKTPLVIWLVERLRAQGFCPGVVLRGYGGSAERGREPLRVGADSDPAVVGDEALLLARRTGAPVAVCRDRVRAARSLLEAGSDLIVADDGLQHLALARDFEIAVFDGEAGPGNGWLLPAGPLREPLDRLARVDAVVINGVGAFRQRIDSQDPPYRGPAGPLGMRLRGDRLCALGGGGERALSELTGQRVHAVAGIGRPERFFAQLRAAGLDPVENAFPDHHPFRSGELAFADDLPVLLTEKDAVRCTAARARNFWYLPVTAELDAPDEAALLGRLLPALRTRAGP